MDDFYIKLGELIKKKRLEKELNTQELADILGVSTGFLNNLENAKTDTFNFELMQRICLTLDISVLNFLQSKELNEDTLLNPSVKKLIELSIENEEILVDNLSKIINSYLQCIKSHHYNSGISNKITDKLLYEINFLSSFAEK